MYLNKETIAEFGTKNNTRVCAILLAMIEGPNNLFQDQGQPKKQEHLEFVVERASPLDWQAYKQIILEAFRNEPEAFGPKQLADAEQKTDVDWQNELNTENRFVYFAKEGEVVLAVGGIRPAKNNKDMWMLFSMYVRPEARRKNIGLQMIEQLQAVAESKNAQKLALYVSTNSKQTPAYTMYLKAGFNEVDELGLVNWIYMEKDLTLVKQK